MKPLTQLMATMLSSLVILAASDVASAAPGWVSIQRHLGPSTPPIPVDRPLISLEDRAGLLALPCVSGVGALSPDRVTLIGQDGTPKQLTRWTADPATIDLLGLRLGATDSRSGRWITTRGMERLGFSADGSMLNRVVHRLELVGGLAPDGKPYIDETLQLSGRIDGIRLEPLTNAALVEGPRELLLPVNTMLSRGQRISQAMPPMLLVRTRSRASECLPMIRLLTDSWGARAGIELRLGATD